MIVSEFPLVQPHLYDAQIPPVVYLSGVLMFVGGLAIVRAHNRWARDWTVLVTLSDATVAGHGFNRRWRPPPQSPDRAAAPALRPTPLQTLWHSVPRGLLRRCA